MSGSHQAVEEGVVVGQEAAALVAAVGVEGGAVPVGAKAAVEVMVGVVAMVVDLETG